MFTKVVSIGVLLPKYQVESLEARLLKSRLNRFNTLYVFPYIKITLLFEPIKLAKASIGSLALIIEQNEVNLKFMTHDPKYEIIMLN